MIHDEHCCVVILWPGFDFNHFSVRNDMIGKEQQLTSGHSCGESADVFIFSSDAKLTAPKCVFNSNLMAKSTQICSAP